jgi:hypothetical protein
VILEWNCCLYGWKRLCHVKSEYAAGFILFADCTAASIYTNDCSLSFTGEITENFDESIMYSILAH